MIHTFQECIKFQLFSVYVNTMREIKRVLETIAEDDETEVITEGTSPAAVAVPVVLVVIIVVIGVRIFIVRRQRRYHRKANRYSTPVQDTDTLLTVAIIVLRQTYTCTTLYTYLYSVV